MRQLLNDLSILTTISVRDLKKLLEKSTLCIADAVNDSKIKNEDITSIDIGVGTLYVKIIGNEVKYKFVGNDYLNKILIEATKENNKLENKLEKTLVDRITNLYKELC